MLSGENSQKQKFSKVSNRKSQKSCRNRLCFCGKELVASQLATQLTTFADYGVALISRIYKIIGLFCKRALYKRRYSAKETYNLINPTDSTPPHMGLPVCVFTSYYRVAKTHRMP